jgi:tetratricopeptide (TPR) repeat protein
MSKARAKRRPNRGSRPRSGAAVKAAPSRDADRARSSVPSWVRWGLPLLVAASAFVAFAPALHNGFVNWDDDKILLENDNFRGLDSSHLRWMFTQYKMGHYHPLTWVSFAMDYRIWGLDDAFGFHLTNLILHALNAALFYFVAVRLLALAMPEQSGRNPMSLHLGATVAALLFAVHPLRVESVAWATERRDVLSVFFLLPCVLCYLRYATAAPRRWWWYIAAIVLLLLSLLSKAWGITVPAVLIVLDVYPLRRIRATRSELFSTRAVRLLAEKIPFAALAAWAAYQAAEAQATAVDTMKSLEEYGVTQRIAQAFYGVGFYVWKTLLPTGLAPIYEIPVKMNPYEPRFVISAIAVIAAATALFVFRRRWPAGLALGLVYVITVSPVLGLAQSGPQLAADRYSYISCMTWALLAGAGVVWCLRARAKGRLPSTALMPLAGVVVAVVAVLAVLTWRQSQVWRTSRDLWEHTLAVYPRTYNAHNNLGILLKQQGHYDEAEEHYVAALAIKPDMPAAINNLGSLRLRKGDVESALELFLKARKLRPQDLSIRMNIGSALLRLDRYDEAIRAYQHILDKNPSRLIQAKAHSNLGRALEEAGRVSEAIPHLERSIELLPKYPHAYNNLAFACKKLGDRPKAIQAFRKTIELIQDTVRHNPRAPERSMYIKACSNLGDLYAETGDLNEAVRFHQMVLELNPKRVFDLLKLGDLMMRLQRYDDAAAYYQRAVDAAPADQAAKQRLQSARQAQQNAEPISVPGR